MGTPKGRILDVALSFLLVDLSGEKWGRGCRITDRKQSGWKHISSCQKGPFNVDPGDASVLLKVNGIYRIGLTGEDKIA